MSWADTPPHDDLAEEAASRDAEADLRAMIAAGRELGPEMDRALAESYLSRHDEPPAPPAPVAFPAPDAPAAFESQSDERNFAPWLIPVIFLMSLLLFAAPFHFGGFFFLIPLIFLLNRNRTQRQRLDTPSTKYGSLSSAFDPTLTTPPMPVTLTHPGARFDVVLMHPGVNKLATIKEVRMLTGMELTTARQMTDYVPCTLLHDVSADRANIALAHLSVVGAHVALQPASPPALPQAASQTPSQLWPPVAQTRPAASPQQWSAPHDAEAPAGPPANPAG